MATQQVTSVTPPSAIEQLRKRRDDAQNKAARLREQLAKTQRAIETIGTASPAFDSLAKERDDLTKQLHIATQEASDAETILSRRVQKDARAKLDAACAEMLQLRAEIIQALQEASDKLGRLFELQEAAPELANQATGLAGPGYRIADPKDRSLLATLAAPIDPYRGKWMDRRQTLLREMTTCPRVLPTIKL